jgi:AmmeMemoRadiSam system protein B
VPHAGYIYSGHVAGAVYSRLELPDRYIILCPNHTGLGAPLAIVGSGEWETPIGNATVDEELAESLKSFDPDLQDDASAHRFEHALEVQLPFLQFLAETKIRFVPITVGTSDLASLERLGDAMAATIRQADGRTLIIASSDMNHYESDPIARVKDQKAIDRMLDLDAEGLYEVVHREEISMCGFGPATAMLTATKQLGATEAELVKYATSGDIFGERDQVVGYAGLIIS